MLMTPNFVNEIIAAHIVQMRTQADCGLSDLMAKRCQPSPGNWTFCHLQSSDDGLKTGGTQSNFLFMLREARSRWRSIRCNHFIHHTVSLQPCSCPDLLTDIMTNSGMADLIVIPAGSLLVSNAVAAPSCCQVPAVYWHCSGCDTGRHGVCRISGSFFLSVEYHILHI